MSTIFRITSLLVGFGLMASAETPAEQHVAAAQHVIRTNPKSSQAYNDLAAALTRRTRETGHVRFLGQAETAVQQAIQLQPGNYDSQKIRIAILLARHQYTQALEAAKDLNHRVPDDIPVWGLLADANIALGNYADAEKDAQWMQDLRPANGPAFIEAARLREVYGDLEGALDFLAEGMRRTSENEVEEQAYLLTRSAHLQLLAGNTKSAGEMLAQALKLFPDYHLALWNLAQLRTSESNYSEAAALLKRRNEAVQSSASLYDLAQALERSGDKAEAEAAFEKFETRASAETAKPFNANRELIFYYADRRADPAKALALAEKEHAARRDVLTQDAYAWALYRNRQFAEAKTQLDQALAVGVREPLLFCHAGRIAAALGDKSAADKFLERASVAGAPLCPAAEVKVAVTGLEPRP